MFTLNSIYVQFKLNLCSTGQVWCWPKYLWMRRQNELELKAAAASCIVSCHRFKGLPGLKCSWICTLQLRNTVNRYIAPHRVVSPIWRPGLKCSCCIYSIQIRNTVQKYSSEIQYTASRHVTALKAGLSAAAALLGLAWNGQDCPNCRRWWQLRTECDSWGLVGMDWCSCRW